MVGKSNYLKASLALPILPCSAWVVALFLVARVDNVCAQNFHGAQPTSYNLHRVSVETGLSQNTVTSVLEDEEGLVWIGTENGLNSYDGYDLRVFKVDDEDPHSLSDNSVRSIFQDSKGRIWIGTFNGLNLVDKKRGSFQCFIHDPENDSTISQNSALAIDEDAEGNIWVATYHGLSCYHPEENRFSRYYYSPDGYGIASDRVYTVFVDRDNRVWAGTENGLSVLSADRQSIRNIPFDNKKPGSLRNYRLRSIFQDSTGKLWFATEGDGVAWLDKATGVFHHFRHVEGSKEGLSSNLVTCITQHKNGKVWFGTDGGGISVYDPLTQKISPFAENSDPLFSSGAVYDIAFTKNGGAWIGLFGKGLFLANENSGDFTYHQYLDSVTRARGKNSVLAFAEDGDGRIWIGTDGSGLYHYNPATNHFNRYGHNFRDPSSISADVVKSLAVDRSGNLYAGTFAGGLNVMPGRSGRFLHYRAQPDNSRSIAVDHVWSLHVDSMRNSVWVGELNGLDRFEMAAKTFTHLTETIRNPITGNVPSVFSIVEDRQHNLWMGMRDGGLLRLNAQREVIRYYLKGAPGVEGTIPQDEILDLLADSKGNIWIGTASHGLWVFDPARESFSKPLNAKELPDAILAILEDKRGNLWISTYKGLYNYHPTSGKWYLFDITDGLPTNEFNNGAKLKARSGRMYMGGLNGFIAFQPEEIPIDTAGANVIFTGLSLFHKEVAPGDQSGVLSSDLNFLEELVLAPNQNVVTLRFAALDHHYPKVNQYKYKLENFDDDWIYVRDHSRSATYTNLPHGEYTFRVNATNHDGIWNREDRMIRIVVLPHWYQTWWFRLLVVIGIALIMFVVTWTRTLFLTRQSAKLQALVDLRTDEINTQKEEIQFINQELLDHNEELRARNEEILLQREQIEEANTKTQQAFTQLKELNENLERVVNERTHELKQTIHRLTETDEGLTTFLYRSSHDLRGPITSLLGLTTLARLENQDPESHAYCDMIDRTCYKMLRFLKRLGNVTSVFKVELTNSWVSISQVMDDVERELRSIGYWPNAQFKLVNELGEYVWTDKDLVRNIIFELVENAFTFVGSRETKVTVNIYKAGAEMVIDVADNGTGIQSDLQAKVFELFFRGSENSRGNGLGLYMVKKSADILNGRVEMVSAPGTGTRVKVSIPLQAPLKELVAHLDSHIGVPQE
jgi:ligand-binding sensor domain-containing protein/signal transduction histidine kinase